MKNIKCFSSIELSEPYIDYNNVKSDVKLKKLNGDESLFEIKIKYKDEINKDHLPILRIAFTMPLLNYGLFTDKIKLDFPISIIDSKILNELNKIFCRDIFVNKILRRRTDYILQEYIPKENEVNEIDADKRAVIEPLSVNKNNFLSNHVDKNKCGVLSSGGKESLLSYNLLKEIGYNVYPLYVNESGGHWRTSLAAYRYHKSIDSNKTQRVWTNIDRFYNFMLDNLILIRRDHRNIRADTYPIRLCIFPYYIFLLIPIFIENKIGNLLIGSEFDDIRTIPKYLGIKHYFGIYDQHQDYDILMNEWYSKRIPGLIQWSAVRNISGLIVERILVKRYPKYAKFQRSCHSCHFNDGEILPCGKCSKCLGVLLFILANRDNPKIMGFYQKDVNNFLKNISNLNLRLDQDEKNHSLYLIGKNSGVFGGEYIDHIEKIHFNKRTCNYLLIPDIYRKKLFKIYDKYTNGYCILKNNKWISKIK